MYKNTRNLIRMTTTPDQSINLKTLLKCHISPDDLVSHTYTSYNKGEKKSRYKDGPNSFLLLYASLYLLHFTPIHGFVPTSLYSNTSLLKILANSPRVLTRCTIITLLKELLGPNRKQRVTGDTWNDSFTKQG